MKRQSNRRLCHLIAFGVAGILTTSLGLFAPVSAQTPPVSAVQPPQYLPRDAAVRHALQNNPYLMTVRQQYGFAQAAVVMAQTYPFNPAFTSIITQNSGPESAGISNRVFNESYVLLEIEMCGQGGHRRAGAAAAATRIEWEVAQQEMAVSIQVIKAYNAALYRQKKLEATEETIKLNEQAVGYVNRLVDAGKLRAADLLLARAELENVRAQSGQVKTALAIARSDLRRLLGTLEDGFVLAGPLDVPLPSTDPNVLTQLALAKRPDLQARQAAVMEAEAALKLIESNRFGNPQVGPLFSYDATRVAGVGGRFTVPLPCFNLKRGEIMKAQTEVFKVRSEIHDLELHAAQDVQAALARLADAKKWAAAYEKDVVPNLSKAKQEMEKLFANNDPAADLSRVITVQRAYLKAIETLLDAHFEVSLAEADLAAAAAEPALALGQTQPPANMPPPAQSPQQVSQPPQMPSNNPITPVRAIMAAPVPLPDARQN